jgi:Lrp/AsnC family leucine-responsive transcriptional regulator
MKFKPTKSLEMVKKSITEHVIDKPDYLFVANLEGEWNMLVVMRIDPGTKSATSKIIEKFSEQVIDYRINKFDIQNVNLLNMSLLLL